MGATREILFDTGNDSGAAKVFLRPDGSKSVVLAIPVEAFNAIATAAFAGWGDAFDPPGSSTPEQQEEVINIVRKYGGDDKLRYELVATFQSIRAFFKAEQAQLATGCRVKDINLINVLMAMVEGVDAAEGDEGVQNAKDLADAMLAKANEYGYNLTEEDLNDPEDEDLKAKLDAVSDEFPQIEPAIKDQLRRASNILAAVVEKQAARYASEAKDGSENTAATA